jgi:hypothetical protein
MDDGLTIDPPVYLIGSMYPCWHCGARMPAVALLAPNVEGAEGEVCIPSFPPLQRPQEPSSNSSGFPLHDSAWLHGRGGAGIVIINPRDPVEL